MLQSAVASAVVHVPVQVFGRTAASLSTAPDSAVRCLRFILQPVLTALGNSADSHDTGYYTRRHFVTYTTQDIQCCQLSEQQEGVSDGGHKKYLHNFWRGTFLE